MKRVLSLFIALSILIISLNIAVSAEENVITPNAESGKYTWKFTGNGETVEVDKNNQYKFVISDDTEVSAVFEAVSQYHASDRNRERNNRNRKRYNK